MSKVLYNWQQSFQADIQQVGGKGWNLGRLYCYGFNVPTGGVIPTELYWTFLESTNLQQSVVEIANQVTIENIALKESREKLARVRERIVQGHFPTALADELKQQLKKLCILDGPVAVRSSATGEDSSHASFAGIHESFLNVLGTENIFTAIKACYASLWTERAVSYRRKMGFADNDVSAAVVIMEMVMAKASGIAFTCDPRTGREDVFTINANFGLGEAIVSGNVDPDRYLLDNSLALLKINSITLGRKQGMTVSKKGGGTEYVPAPMNDQRQVLSNGDIIRLGYLISRVQGALGKWLTHQDIEWVFDGKDFALVQARPVTALPKYTFPALQSQPEIWSNTNLKDNLPIVASTLNLSMGWLPNLILHAPFKSIGYPIPDGLNFIKLFQGRPYLNMSAFQWICYDCLGMKPAQITAALGGHEPQIEINESRSVGKMLARKGRILKTFRAASNTKKRAKRSFAKVRNQMKTLLRHDYFEFTAKDFLEVINQIEKTAIEYSPVFEFIAMSGTFPNQALVKLLEGSFPDKGNALANSILTGAGQITSAEHGYRLLQLAEIARNDAGARNFFKSNNYNALSWREKLPDNSCFKQAFSQFLEEYGHRAIFEADLINPRWREDPSYPLSIISSMMETSDLGKLRAAQAKKRNQAWQEIKRRMPFYKRWLIKILVNQVEKSVELREMAKSILVLLYEPMRKAAQEWGRRLQESGILQERADIYHGSIAEINSILQGYWDGRGLDALVNERKAKRKELEKITPPDFVIGGTPKFANQICSVQGNAIQGLGVAAGKASGIARLIFHPMEAETLQVGDVLVAPSTDPGWTPLFLKAAAIVMETGGFLSHGAIVAREYGVPAVVNIPGAMKMLKDGQKIIVDGDEGKVFLLETSS